MKVIVIPIPGDEIRMHKKLRARLGLQIGDQVEILGQGHSPLAVLPFPAVRLMGYLGKESTYAFVPEKLGCTLGGKYTLQKFGEEPPAPPEASKAEGETASPKTDETAEQKLEHPVGED